MYYKHRLYTSFLNNTPFGPREPNVGASFARQSRSEAMTNVMKGLI